MRLPYLERIGNRTIAAKLYAPTRFHVEGFSAGSYTGATIVIGLCALFPECPISATLGAIAMGGNESSIKRTIEIWRRPAGPSSRATLELRWRFAKIIVIIKKYIQINIKINNQIIRR